MPYISTKTNVSMTEESQRTIRERLGESIPMIPGKSEQWLMLSFESMPMSFAGSEDACALVSVLLYGKAVPSAYEALTAQITRTLQDTLHIPPERIYVAYQETMHWGWNGSNF